MGRILGQQRLGISAVIPYGFRLREYNQFRKKTSDLTSTMDMLLKVFKSSSDYLLDQYAPKRYLKKYGQHLYSDPQ